MSDDITNDMSDDDPAAKPAKGKAKKKSTRTPAQQAAMKRWASRALIATVLGLTLGAGAGVVTVNRLEPGRGTGVDSLAVMLDSIAKGRIPEPTAAERSAEAQRRADSAAAAQPAAEPELLEIPAVVGLEEGAARNALIDAGLQVGEVQFDASDKPAGTVLATVPAAGERVPAQSAVTLVLSDGRSAPPDTLFRLPPLNIP